MNNQRVKVGYFGCGKTVMILSFALFGCAPSPQKPLRPFYNPEDSVTIELDQFQRLREFGDLLRGGDKNLLEELNDPSLTAVTREYGLSIIKQRTFPFQSPQVKATITPWSSWWFPKRDRTFFDDSKVSHRKDYKNLSILTKFDLYQKLNTPGFASAREEEKYQFNNDALDWEGLCDAWSIAAVTFPEPRRSVTVSLGSGSSEKLTFSVGELKGLLLKTIEAVSEENFKYYGQKFTGQENAWIYPDIFPEQFHRLIEVQLIEKQQPFIMDIDPGVEVWNFPVFKANYVMQSIPDKPNAIFVRMWLYLADSLKSFDQSYVGTKEIVREYDYVLEGERNQEGDLVVTYGYWVKSLTGVDSRHDHPDFIMIPPEREQLKRASWNKNIPIELVDQLLKSSY